MILSPSVRLSVLGVVLCISLLISARIAGVLGAPPFLATMGIASLIYLLVLRELRRTPVFPRPVIVSCLLLAAIWRIPFLLVAPGPQDDVLRYLWDGRVQRLGFNPYTSIPSDPALAKLHTAETRQLNNPDVPSPYPAGAQLFFRIVTTIHESGSAFKIAFAACDLAIVLLLLAELRPVGQQSWVLAYAWHPLLVPCLAYNGHIDILGVLLLLVSEAALRRHRTAFAAIAFALAIAVKFLPLVLLPLFWRRIRLGDATVAALIVGLLYLPFLKPGPIPLGSVRDYLEHFRFNDPVFALLEAFLRPRVAAGVAVAAGFLIAIWMRRKYPAISPHAWAWPMAASLVCAPTIYPWYLLWLVPFLRLPSMLPLTTWTLSILSVFFVWYWNSLGHPWRVPGWVLLIEFGTVALGTLLPGYCHIFSFHRRIRLSK